MLVCGFSDKICVTGDTKRIIPRDLKYYAGSQRHIFVTDFNVDDFGIDVITNDNETADQPTHQLQGRLP